LKKAMNKDIPNYSILLKRKKLTNQIGGRDPPQMNHYDSM